MLCDVESVLLSAQWKDIVGFLKNAVIFSSLNPYFFEM